MNRRDFLAMLASAPIAALAPWSKALAATPVSFKTGTAVAKAMIEIDGYFIAFNNSPHIRLSRVFDSNIWEVPLPEDDPPVQITDAYLRSY